MRAPKRSRRKVAAKVATDLMLAPAVMAIRIPLLVAEAGGTDPFRKETTRAFAEKAAAAAEGMAAAQLAVARSLWAFWPEVLSGRVPSLLNGQAGQQALDAALKPAGKRVRANFRRLSSQGK